MNDFIQLKPQDFPGGIKKNAWQYIEKCHSRISKLERMLKALNEKYVDARFEEAINKEMKRVKQIA